MTTGQRASSSPSYPTVPRASTLAYRMQALRISEHEGVHPMNTFLEKLRGLLQTVGVIQRPPLPPFIPNPPRLKGRTLTFHVQDGREIHGRIFGISKPTDQIVLAARWTVMTSKISLRPYPHQRYTLMNSDTELTFLVPLEERGPISEFPPGNVWTITDLGESPTLPSAAQRATAERAPWNPESPSPGAKR